MGSNTTRLLVADVTRHADGRVTHEPIEARTTITRLAEGVDTRRMLLPVAITRTRNALVEYRAAARELGAVFVLATATSAVRDADNGEAFLGEVEHGFGFRARLLEGDDEAAWTWRGVTSDPDLAERVATGRCMLLDIGGGSTELVFTDGGTLDERDSLQLGSVRLTERCLPSDPPTADEVARARAHARGIVAERFPQPGAIDLAVGVAGTVTTVVTVRDGIDPWDPTRVHGAVLRLAEVEQVLERLAALPQAERAAVAGLEPGRAPVIVGGLLVLASTLEHLGLDAITVSVRDILDGIVLAAGEVALDEGIVELPEPFGRTVC
jgi:exopolyphosphatase/guanosine-5'-triphosphate,3'-diphosphate pyrophosphatase